MDDGINVMCWGMQSLRASAHENASFASLRPASLLGGFNTPCIQFAKSEKTKN